MNSLTEFYGKVGQIEGHILSLQHLTCKVDLKIEIVHGTYTLGGNIIAYRRHHNVRAAQILKSIDGLAFELAHNYSGNFAVSFAYQQECTVTVDGMVHSIN